MVNDVLSPSDGTNTNNSQNKLRSPGDWHQSTSFRTPEEVAAADLEQENAADQSGTANVPDKKPKKSLKERLKSLTKKQWAIIVVVALIVLGGIGFAIYHFFLQSKPAPPKPVVKKQVVPPPAPQPLVSTLTGLPISDAAINQRPVTAVMIENSPDARPQSGLAQAGVVFEAVAEGGITRFLTLFQDTEPDYIGPVRSVRPYYIQWLEGFDAAVAHVGGSGDALAMLRNGEAKDLDQFSNPEPYHRISTRYAPHNMYSSVVALRQLQEQKGYASHYTGFPRKPEAKSSTPNATNIDLSISGAYYNVHYDYDGASNSYKRSEGGAPHMDEKSGQLSPKVVVALVMQQGSSGIYTTYGNIGSGEAYVFQDGTLTAGTWAKNSPKDQITFTNKDGTPLKLNPGQTWISVVNSTDHIVYK